MAGGGASAGDPARRTGGSRRSGDAPPDRPVEGFSIGAVLAGLRDEFPDVTISKIRYLESEGLVEPARTPGGYRKFTPADVERLRYILRAQRDHYLPLRVIKEHLSALDRGLAPPEVGTARPVAPVPAEHGLPVPDDFRAGPDRLRLTRAELLNSAGIADETLAELEAYGLVIANGGHFDGDALLIARTAGSLAQYGVEPRHLRAFRTAAEREAGLVEQVVRPLLAQRDERSGDRADEVVRDLAALSVRLHAALVRTALARAGLGG